MDISQVNLLIDQMMAQADSGESPLFSGRRHTVKWSYVQACILKGYMDRWKITRKKKYLDFCCRYFTGMMDENGLIREVDLEYFSTDQLRMACILLDLADATGKDCYLITPRALYAQIARYPRTADGTFWHKQNYPNQVWLDGIYMAQPFYLECMKRFDKQPDFEDSIRQILSVRKTNFDKKLDLYYHACDISKSIFWADPVTGRSPNVWLRAIGWLAMALVDCLEILSDTDAQMDGIKEMLNELITGILAYQQEGMWRQLPAVKGNEMNYFETSGSLMLAVAMMKGARLCFLPAENAVFGCNTLQAICERYLYTRSDGMVCLGGICQSAGLGMHPETGVRRNGSVEYYLQGECIVENNGHGVGPLFMAVNEILLRNR